MVGVSTRRERIQWDRGVYRQGMTSNPTAEGYIEACIGSPGHRPGACAALHGPVA